MFRITVFWPSVALETIGVDIQSMIGMQSMWTCTMDYFMIYLICDVCYLWHLMFSVYEIFWRTCISRITQNRVVKSRILVNNSSSSRVMQHIHVTDHEDRGYYMPVRGYEFYLWVVNSISHEWMQRTSEISSWTPEDKIHIHKRAYDILFII